MLNQYNLALFKVHCTAVLFGLTGVLGAIIQSSSEVLVFGRVLIAFVALSLFLLVKSQRIIKLSTKDMLIQVILGTMLISHWITFYIAIKVGGVAVGTLGFASFPAFVALFEVLILKESIKRREIILLMAITLGLALITPKYEFSNQATQGLLWGIFSGAIYGALAIFNRYNAEKLSGTQASWWQYLAGALVLTPYCLTELPKVTAIDWFWIGCLGLLCTSLAYTIFISSLNIIKARTAAMIISLEPVYAILIAWLWLDQVPTIRMIIGGLIILISVAIVNFRR
ncbi:DMT family transporter [Pasteurella bettyae]|uniref:DMT family transporter n=1 Tax=Pasteurella bettyae TaxID=752 RepID=UPI003D2DE069